MAYMGESCIETMEYKLQLLVEEGVFFEDDNSFKKLKGALIEVKDFMLDVRNLEDSISDLGDFVRRHRQQFHSSFGLDQALSGFDSIGAASIFQDFMKNLRQLTGYLEDFAHENWQCFYSLLLQNGLPPTGANSCFQESLENFWQQIRDFYKETWDSVVQFFSKSRRRYLKLHHGIPLPSVKISDLLHDWTGKWGKWEEESLDIDEFFHLFMSLSVKVEAILRRGELFDSRFAAVLEPVRVNLVPEEFSQNWQRGYYYESEVFKQSPAVDVFVAHLCCCLLIAEIDWKPSEPVRKTNPATLAYTVWDSKSSSLTLSTKAMTCIDSIVEFCGDDHGLVELKVELRLVKTFFLCARKLCSSSKSTELLADSAHQNWQQFYSFLLQLKDGLPPSELAGATSNLRRILKSYRQKISKLYAEMSGSLNKSVSQVHDYYKSRNSYLHRFLESRCPQRDEFMEFLYVFLDNLLDIVSWGEASNSRLEELLDPLQEKLVFLKSFILFASLQGKVRRELVEHCGVVALSAAHLCYICWFFRDDNQVLDGIHLKILELIDNIKPADYRAQVMYIHVLESRSTSPTLSTKQDVIIAGEFVDSLLGHLWELLLNCPTCFMVSLKHQLWILFEGLQFLKNILNKEKYDGLDERIKDLVGSVLNDTGIVIFSLYQNDIREASAEEIDVKLFCLLDKFELIKAEVEEKYPLVSIFDFPTTNALGLIDLLQEKLKELASCKIDPVFSFVEDRVHFLRSYLKNAMEQHNQNARLQAQTIQEVLLFLQSFLENNLEQHAKKKELQIQTLRDGLVFIRSFLENNRDHCNPSVELQALRSCVMEVAYRAEFAIDSLVVGDVSFYSLMLFDKVTKEINHLKTKAWEIDSIKTQKPTNSLRDVPSQAGSKWTGEFHQFASPGNFLTTNKTSVDLKDQDQAIIYQLIGGFHKVLVQGSISTIDKAEGASSKVNKAEITLQDQEQAISNELIGGFQQVSLEGSFSTVDKAVVALQDQEQAIIDQLINGRKQLQVISIVGMAGLGKTFLAQRVYRDASVTSHFHIQAWCCISQTYCKKGLLLELLACIDPKVQYSEMNQDDLAHKVRKCLSQKKYLIVLDDVWDIEALNALKMSFPDHTIGSRILLTSRHDGISGTPHQLRLLKEPESWDLLQKKLAIIRKEGYTRKQEVLGRQIAKKCKGLPLSIVIISGILASLDEVGWEEIAESLSSNDIVGATEQCKSILELSYRHLPDHLKPCLLYFGAFGEDQEISIRRLIWLWIAEGFVEKNESESLEKIAEGYIMALINRSLVMVGKQRSIGGVKTCCIHDLLHVFFLGKAKDQNFLQLIRGYDEFLKFDEPHRLRRLSIHSQPKHFLKSRIFCPRIRSLLHSSRGVGSREVLFHLSFIFHLKLLKVLDLGQISLGSTFPSEFSLLIQLRFLAILGWLKGDIPSSLERLSNLETFLVTTLCSGDSLSILQDTLVKMQKVKHLHVRGALIDLRLANDNTECSSTLCNLDSFSTLKLYLGKSMENMMRKFPHIRKLKCCPHPSEESSDSKTVMAMDFLSQLESLELDLSKVTAHSIEFHLPLNLKKLTLAYFSWSIISTIRNLQHLEVLKLLRQADGVGEWDMEEMEEEESFSALKFLKLKDLRIVRWRGSGDHFPSLERLILESCEELEELPLCLQETLTLQLIEARGCLYSIGEFVRDIEKQHMDYGKKDLKIVISEEIEESSSWSDGNSDGWSW